MSSTSKGRALLVAAGVATVAAVIGAIYLQPPEEARARRLDERRVRDLAALEATVNEYWNRKKALPKSLETMAADGLQASQLDPETKAPYKYTSTGSQSFQLCATFAFASDDERRANWPANAVQWAHPNGFVCFDRTIKSPASGAR